MIKNIVSKNKVNFPKVYNTLWIMASTGIHSIFQWLLIIVMTKVYSIETVGQYSWSMALITPIITFLGFNLRATQLTDIKNKYKISDYLIIRVISSIITSLIIGLILFINENVLFAIITTLIVLTVKISELFSETYQNDYLKSGLFKRYGLSFILRSVLSFTLFLIITVLTKNFLFSLSGYSFIWFSSFLFFDTKLKPINEVFKGYTLDYKILVEIISISLPLAFVSSVNTLYSAIPKYFVEYFMDMESLGIFSTTSYVSLIGGIFVSGVTLTFTTDLANLFNNYKIKKFRNIVILQQLLVSVVCLLIFGFFYFLGDTIIPLIYTAEFVNYLDVVLLLIISTSFKFTATVLGTACTSIRLNKEQFYVALICILIVTISGYTLIPTYGLRGAAYSLILAYIFKNIFLGIILKSELDRKYIFKSNRNGGLNKN